MEEKRLIQLIKEKQGVMHTTYLHAGKNLRDEKVLAASEEIDHLINAIMRRQIFTHKIGFTEGQDTCLHLSTSHS
ncbi:Spo0E like sporulation regulatory protein [Aneurinibacillus soli]|uniref:Spo0E like sporulation regulatory protein n=1 Tax=Aneurinibacillus soli TaxID=1500254 RepID=A0A0U5AYS0_9BACL|nr:aspartyl-phosphate phosphatase Spo0E family protein [Aneurinibacillus soli]PYE63060.1 Spo0E like sporulation regulatory protein [Aneurinibacillus soli]BAU28881.1 Spo0E like sporulation regulatory protein [Aneurinibacillus soli]